MATGHYIRSEKEKQRLRTLQSGVKQSKETISKRVAHFTGEKSPWWKGPSVGYRGLHIWVQQVLGKTNKCESCGKKGTGHKMHWANISGQYLREISDWVRLCVKCHKDFDMNRIQD